MNNHDILDRLSNMFKQRGMKGTFIRIVSKIKRKLIISVFLNRNYFNDNIIHVAFYPSGGLGDYIISKSVLEEMLEYTKCRVTIFCDKTSFAKAIYSDVAAEFKPCEIYDAEYYKYDIALCVEHFVHVDNYNAVKVKDLSKELAEKLEYIKSNWDELYVKDNIQCFREKVQFERCRLKGLNRWTELRMGGAFRISDYKVDIPLNGESHKRWERNYSGKRYITFNYGSDSMIPGKKQIKMWIPDKYEKLIELIHLEYKDIKVLQLGSADSEKIKGADEYILGEDIEYVKYLLKGSLCHIDCEGGLVHLATQFDTKCIVIFGPTPLHMYGYDQNINLVSNNCSGCMGLHKEWAYKCYKGYEVPMCINDISCEMVYRELEKVLMNEDFKKIS